MGKPKIPPWLQRENLATTPPGVRKVGWQARRNFSRYPRRIALQCLT
jgi:hypothetical protein